MVSRQNIESLLEDARPESVRAQAFYCDDDVFAMDMQKIVSRKWLLVDHASRISEPGQFFVYEVELESIIVIRDKDMKVNALFNVCRHRGSLVCLEKEGHKTRLTCPYHAWSYGLDGRLKAARFMPEDFDPEQHGLHRCHVRVHHGLIFLNLSPGPEPEFDQDFGVFEPILDFHGFADAKIAHRQAYPTDANWKLVVENFFECYHCFPAHPEFCSRHPRDALIAIGAGPSSGPADAVEAFAPVLAQWEAQAAKLGRPLGAVDDDEHSAHMKFCQQRPHRSDIQSETQDGQQVARLMGKRTGNDHGRMHLSFSPFNQIIANNDFAALILFTPRSAMFTDVEIIWLVDGRADTVDVERMIWMWDVTTRQDKVITENNQRGIRSSRYRPGSLSNQERRVATFNKWYFNQLKTEVNDFES
jgi:phenylpropionate dioxygenase-like ring-hydroxylating dioxygenase large terminal subunit